MVESPEDHNDANPHVEEPDLVDKDYPGDNDPAADGSLDVGGSAGGPEVPQQGQIEAPGGLSGDLPEGGMAGAGDEGGMAGAGDEGGMAGAGDEGGMAGAGDEGGMAGAGDEGGARGEPGFPGGPASGTGGEAELDREDVPETSSEMPPGRKFGTPGITDGT